MEQMEKWMLLVSGCPILLSSLGGSEPDVLNDSSSAGSLWVCMGVRLAHYFKHMIFTDCFALGQSAEPVHCSRRKESTLRQCVASLHLLYAYHTLGIYYLMNLKVIAKWRSSFNSVQLGFSAHGSSEDQCWKAGSMGSRLGVYITICASVSLCKTRVKLPVSQCCWEDREWKK